MLKIKRIMVLILVSLIFGSNAVANQLSNKWTNTFAGIHPVFTLETGASISQVGQSQSFAPLDLCAYHYNAPSSVSDMIWGGFIGSEVWQTPRWLVTVGLGYYQPSSMSAKGSFTQGADAVSADTFQYSYQVKSQQLLAEGKIAWIVRDKFQPYFMVGIGSAFNEAYGYQTNVPPYLEFTPTYATNKETNFSYAIGVGIDTVLSETFRFGIGYRFTDLGKANLGAGQIDSIPISNTLQQSHLYANQIFAQLTYVPFA